VKLRKSRSTLISVVFSFAAVGMSLASGASGAEKSDLSKYAGTWAVKPSLCGIEPTLDNTFPLVISKDGKRISNFERSCEVVKAQDQGQGLYSVRSACEAEGDPDFYDELFKFSATKVVIRDKKNGKKSEFFNCNKRNTKATAAAGNSRKPVKIKVVTGPCHMDYCEFEQIRRILSQSATPSGYLVQVQYRSGSVYAPVVDADRDQYADVEVPSFEKSRDGELIMHCSKQRPFAAFKDKNGLWRGLLLDLPEGGASYLLGTVTLFWAICENTQIGIDSHLRQFTKLGYGNKWRDDSEGDSINFESMDDILAFANHQ
jgi:hypothetical protein